jgi:glycine betaine/choline ABC-type transport system substrate-binding protein
MPAAAVAAAFTFAGCGIGGLSTGGQAKSPPRRIVPGRNHMALTIGTPPSAEGAVLAQVYEQALRAAGYRPRAVAGLRGADAWPVSARGPLSDFRSRLSRRGLVALPPASARLGLGVAMGRARAKALGAGTVSELLRSHPRARIAGPRGCARDPACLPPLRRAYGLRRVHQVRPDLVQDELRSGRADAILVPRTDPHLSRAGERLLADDRRALPGRALTLVVSARVVRAAGPGLATAVEAAGSQLGDLALAELVARVGFDELAPATVARQYLHAAGLLRPGSVRIR